jgi:multiple sugar transport system permease protein
MRRRLVATMLSYAALALLALLFVAPVLLMMAGSLKPEARVLTEAGSLKAFLPGNWTLQNYRDVFARVDFARYLGNSLIITGSVVVAGLVVNSLAGYAFARLAWRGRRLLFTLTLAILVLPLEAIAVPLFYQVTWMGWRDDYLVQILPFIANAFSVYLFYTFFVDLPPELEEAARLDGAGPLRTFATIIVPNSKPVFASVAILSFLGQWGVFIWPLLVTSGERVRPLSLAIATFYTLPPLQWGDIFAFGVMMVSPILVVFLFFQRWFVRGVVATGLKG